MARLSDICLKIGSGATPTGGKSAYLMKGISLIRSQNVLDISFAEDGLAYISDEQARKLQNVEILEGDILLNITGDSVARVCIVPNHILPARVNQHVAIIRVDKTKADNNYILYSLIKSKKTLLALASAGSTRNALTKKMIEEFEVFLPSLAEQKRIASILSSLDDKIAVNRRINANLEAQAEALFKSWFVDFTPFKDQPFVDSELGPIPQGWKVGKLGDYCEVKSGYAFKSSWWTNKGYKIIKIKNISENGDINLNDCSCVLPENCDKAKNFIANTGDIVIAMTGATIGKFNIIPKIDEKFYINQRVGKFFLGEKPIEKVPYIYCFLKQENISTQIIQKGQGSAQPNISGADIESIPMLTPMSIILKYNKMCQPLFEKILSNRLESKKLSALRDTLLPKLMSGEIKL